MSFRLTGLLLAILAVLGVVVYFVQNRDGEESVPVAPWVYNVEMGSIVGIEVQYQGKTVGLDWNTEKEEWVARDPSLLPVVDQDRMNGIRLLLSGPRSERAFDRVDDLSRYGFNNPRVTATVTLDTGENIVILVGNNTPDDREVYVKEVHYDPVYTVDASWGQEMIRFVSEPPIPATPTPVPDTPTPAPAASASPSASPTETPASTAAATATSTPATEG